MKRMPLPTNHVNNHTVSLWLKEPIRFFNFFFFFFQIFRDFIITRKLIFFSYLAMVNFTAKKCSFWKKLINVNENVPCYDNHN